MKKTILFVGLLAVIGLTTGCAEKNGLLTKNPLMVQSYQQGLTKRTSCKVDMDCVAVEKGCCLCDGKFAVNKRYAAKLEKQRLNACGVGPCTMQMCYTDIDVACVSGACVGTLKSMDAFAVAN